MHECFAVKAASDAPGMSVGGFFPRLRSCALYDHFFCLEIVNIVDFAFRFLLLARRSIIIVAFLYYDELDFIQIWSSR